MQISPVQFQEFLLPGTNRHLNAFIGFRLMESFCQEVQVSREYQKASWRQLCRTIQRV